jgi:glycerophosphoryl diester phosphodiesterase
MPQPSPLEPQSRRHRFDIVAYDQFDVPLLVVEIKRSGDIRSVERLVEDTKRYVSAAARKAPFFLIVTPREIDLFRREAEEWTLAYTFDTADVLRRYDQRYGDEPVYESYLASLVQVWLNDIAYNWHEGTPPETKVFENLDVLNALRDGSMAADATL